MFILIFVRKLTHPFNNTQNKKVELEHYQQEEALFWETTIMTCNNKDC